MGKLTAVAVKAALANPGTYQDGDGLFLKVDKRGGAYWNLRLQQDGKRRDIGVGSAKLVTLAEAAELPKAVKAEKRDVLTERKDEEALAHKTPDAVQAAYRRTTYLGTPENPGARVKLMEAWGSYCSGNSESHDISNASSNHE